MVVDISIGGKLENTSKTEKIMFLMKFYIIFIFIFIVLSYFSKYFVYDTAYLSYIFIKIIIPNAKLLNNFIFLPNSTIEVVKECTGMFLIAGFLSLSIIYARDLKEFLIGILFIFLAFFTNILRIVLVCYLINTHPRNPWFYHDIAGYAVILTIVPLLIIVYLKIIEYYRKLSQLEGNDAIYKRQYYKN